MQIINPVYQAEINQRFESSWEKLALIPKETKQNKEKATVTKLYENLKWSTAYSCLQSYCGPIIKEYTPFYGMVVKRFWIEYCEEKFDENIPPTPQEFFEWYCDSSVIKHEEDMYLTL